jgi:hypothetical protein
VQLCAPHYTSGKKGGDTSQYQRRPSEACVLCVGHGRTERGAEGSPKPQVWQPTLPSELACQLCNRWPVLVRWQGAATVATAVRSPVKRCACCVQRAHAPQQLLRCVCRRDTAALTSAKYREMFGEPDDSVPATFQVSINILITIESRLQRPSSRHLCIASTGRLLGLGMVHRLPAHMAGPMGRAARAGDLSDRVGAALLAAARRPSRQRERFVSGARLRSWRCRHKGTILFCVDRERHKAFLP